MPAQCQLFYKPKMSRISVKKYGFSLVELVIVVVIIGTIAGIAIPRISGGAKGSAEAALRANLHAIRSAIDMFAAEHGGLLPGANDNSGTFWNQLILATDYAGNHTGPGRDLGPYLREKVEQTVGPSAGKFQILFSASSPPTVVETPPNSGWTYNKTTGAIIANTDALDESGVAFKTY